MADNRILVGQTPQKESGHDQRFFTFKATQLVWLLFGILEVLIALRIGLKLIGANPDNSFAGALYGFTNLFLFPFSGLVGTPGAGGMVLEISSMIAMIVYGLIAWALERIIWVIFYRPRGDVTQPQTINTDQQNRG